MAFVVEGAQARFELGKNCWVGNVWVVEAAVFWVWLLVVL